MSKEKTFVVKGWVEVEVYAEIKAHSLAEAKRIWQKNEGSGVPDDFTYEEGNWCSKVNLESIAEKKEIHGVPRARKRSFEKNCPH